MKYWNKQKKARENHWTEVRMPDNHNRTWMSMKLWCQLHESKKRFYCGPYSKSWYFEDAHDALVFKLILGYK